MDGNHRLFEGLCKLLSEQHKVLCVGANAMSKQDNLSNGACWLLYNDG
jgi:hypothetical protein